MFVKRDFMNLFNHLYKQKIKTIKFKKTIIKQMFFSRPT